jgi:hypothetical protein
VDDFDTKYWTYRMEWRLGPKGGISWFYDGDFIWSMEASSFGEYKVCEDKPGLEPVCQMTPKRQVRTSVVPPGNPGICNWGEVGVGVELRVRGTMLRRQTWPGTVCK